jgi:hypothetical protein
MKTFEQICHQIEAGEFEFTRHALQRLVERNISEVEIRQVGENGQLIEDYPDDKYTPSCLIFGLTEKKRAIHIQVSYADTPMVRIITLYEPDPAEWIEFRERR